MKAELFIRSDLVIGEGPVWDSADGALWFIDVLGQKVFRSRNGVIEKELSFDQTVGFAVLREQGGLLVGMRDGLYFSDEEGNVSFVADPEPGRSDGRFNDGKVDPAGRAWGGTMSLLEGDAVKADSGLYCLDACGRLSTGLDEVMQGNGMGWTKDSSRFYFVDTLRYTVSEYDYDLESGRISNGRVCFRVPKEEGLPDGMCVDDEGMIWLALWGGFGVLRIDPRSGSVLEKLELPCPNVTSCCFGGEGLDELYITTAAILTDKEQYPLAGSIFRARPGVTGRPSYRYRG